MADKPSPMNQTISLSAAERHDRLCDEFEKAWNDGKKPRIEDFLQQVPLDEQPALLCSMAKVEKDLREDDEILGDFRKRQRSRRNLFQPDEGMRLGCFQERPTKPGL